jgi:hypothetical protein
LHVLNVNGTKVGFGSCGDDSLSYFFMKIEKCEGRVQILYYIFAKVDFQLLFLLPKVKFDPKG